MFAGIGGFREGLTRAGGFVCAGHCELDRNAERSYRTLFDTKGEWYCEDIRNAEPEQLPEFDLLCGGFPCQSFSVAGHRGGFSDPRGTLFFELARLAEARKPAYLLFENVPGLLYHDCGRTFAAILHELEGMGYGRKKLLARGNRREGACNRTGEPSVTFCGEERQSVRRSRISKGNAASHKDSTRRNSRDFGVPQSRKRVYLIGYLDERCRGKVFPFTETAGTSLKQIRSGSQGERVYSCEGERANRRLRTKSTARKAAKTENQNDREGILPPATDFDPACGGAAATAEGTEETGEDRRPDRMGSAPAGTPLPPKPYSSTAKRQHAPQTESGKAVPLRFYSHQPAASYPTFPGSVTGRASSPADPVFFPLVSQAFSSPHARPRHASTLCQTAIPARRTEPRTKPRNTDSPSSGT